MNKELEKYYEARFTMFAEPGWKELEEDIDKMIEATASTDGIDTLEQLHFRKGELSILRWIRTLPEVSLRVYEQLKEEKDASL